MTILSSNNGNGNHERRRYPRYYAAARLTLAIEDESLKESIGIGEPQDISLGGLRVTNLPACPNVKVGDQLGLLLLDGEDALSLTGGRVYWTPARTSLTEATTIHGEQSDERDGQRTWGEDCG